MSDRITSAQQNLDGSWDFAFTFDGGNGLTAGTSVHVPAPMGTPAVLDPNGNVITPAVAAVPYTAQTAAAASLPIAAAQKAVWLASVAGASVIGNVVLP